MANFQTIPTATVFATPSEIFFTVKPRSDNKAQSLRMKTIDNPTKINHYKTLKFKQFSYHSQKTGLRINALICKQIPSHIDIFWDFIVY